MKSPYKQGIFTPTNPSKYTGTTPIVYRSGLELLYCRWCDRNDNVVEWGSESIVVPYISPKDGKLHRYFVDGNIKLQTPEGIKKYLIEIKPSSQTQPPNPSGRKKRSTILHEQFMWAVNRAKWSSAEQWCKKHGYSFAILTEKHLK